MPTWLQRIFGSIAPAEAGERGERHAADWLRRERGFAIVARNWRSPRDRRAEIDLVCRDGEVLVFVEVKARAADALVPGYYAVDRRKKEAMRRAIDAYLAGLAPAPRTFRFDVVEVSLGPDARPGEVLHLDYTKSYCAKMNQLTGSHLDVYAQCWQIGV